MLVSGSIAHAPPSEAIGTRDIDSTPPAMIRSSQPDLTRPAAWLTASSPEAQNRLSCTPPTVSGSPAASAAVLAMSAPWSPIGVTQPRTTSSTSVRSRPGSRLRSSSNSPTTSCTGFTSCKEPDSLPRPRRVRMASYTSASVMTAIVPSEIELAGGQSVSSAVGVGGGLCSSCGDTMSATPSVNTSAPAGLRSTIVWAGSGSSAPVRASSNTWKPCSGWSMSTRPGSHRDAGVLSLGLKLPQLVASAAVQTVCDVLVVDQHRHVRPVVGLRHAQRVWPHRISPQLLAVSRIGGRPRRRS